MSEVILDAVRFSTRIAIIGLVMVTVMLALLSATLSFLLFRIHTDNERLLKQFQNEKVCSENNQGQACQALFERLSTNISDEQRRQLACTVFITAAVRPNIDC